MILAVRGGAGVGRSTLAFNLAWALDAVVVDAALGLSDLVVRRGPDLHDVLGGRAAPDEAIDDAGPVPLLPCGSPLAGREGAEPDALRDLLGAVADERGRVVVDCPAGLGGDTGAVMRAASACVVVTTAEPASVADAVRSGTLARAFGAPVARVALGRAESAPPVAAIERALGAPVVAVPASERLETAMASGQPVGAVAPACPAAAAIERLAAGIQHSCRS